MPPKITPKKYKCRECGHITTHSTNHYGETYSWGNYDVCPKCPPYKRPTVWECCEDPSGDPDAWIPEPWTLTTVRVQLRARKK